MGYLLIVLSPPSVPVVTSIVVTSMELVQGGTSQSEMIEVLRLSEL